MAAGPGAGPVPRVPGPGAGTPGCPASEAVRGPVAARDHSVSPSFSKAPHSLTLARLPDGRCQALHAVFLAYFMEAGGAWQTAAWDLLVPRTRSPAALRP